MPPGSALTAALTSQAAHITFQPPTQTGVIRIQPPLDDYPCFMLIETSGSDEQHDQEKLTRFLENTMERGLVMDGTLASNSRETVRGSWPDVDVGRRVCSLPPAAGLSGLDQRAADLLTADVLTVTTGVTTTNGDTAGTTSTGTNTGTSTGTNTGTSHHRCGACSDRHVTPRAAADSRGLPDCLPAGHCGSTVATVRTENHESCDNGTRNVVVAGRGLVGDHLAQRMF
ncbi:D-2-hydroxyglutarate--pyruvate transhydrogenase DLD2 [Amphibalanus amphitrite]|uniref:D-2-hydroxyglutarate--pyruvate transhydrogenase DLD2 n=1 Tax=Amphibalanus amphitrite TaxID=1232801 RepID=A0A6A4WN45_AMPAM|nr:D-2-hydroxyglutarate--pyruvate transhydrogenase DLD2 [Amphibalanus amphitrite]